MTETKRSSEERARIVVRGNFPEDEDTETTIAMVTMEFRACERQSYAAGFEAAKEIVAKQVERYFHPESIQIHTEAKRLANSIRSLPLTGSPSTDIAPPREGEAK